MRCTTHTHEAVRKLMPRLIVLQVKNRLPAIKTQPKASRERACTLDMSKPTAGMVMKSTSAPMDTASPASSAVYPTSICRNCGISTILCKAHYADDKHLHARSGEVRALEEFDIDDRLFLEPLPQRQPGKAQARDDH